jgi:nitrile hydratase accessory protein
MTSLVQRIAADANGPAAIPRRNGEPVFNEPWESRVFGMAVGLCERGFYDWDEFRERLITEISSADEPGGTSTYYESFLKALERLMLDKCICRREELARCAIDTQLRNVENSDPTILVKD